MDYQQELNKLEEQEAMNSSEFWKPEAGKYEVKALGELEPGKPYEEEGKEPQPRMQIRLLVSGQEVIWTMPLGRTPASTYGQLCKLATENGNKLTEVSFKIVVNGTGKNKRFTIA